jgi:hypothetical protein
MFNKLANIKQLQNKFLITRRDIKIQIQMDTGRGHFSLKLGRDYNEHTHIQIQIYHDVLVPSDSQYCLRDAYGTNSV